MSNINYIVYGHTSYLDVLEIQTDYICSHGDVILFINSNDLGLDYLYDKYTRVIFYNDSKNIWSGDGHDLPQPRHRLGA